MTQLLQEIHLQDISFAGLCENMPIPDALKMSAKASSIAVSREGAVPSIPYRDEVMKALSE